MKILGTILSATELFGFGLLAYLAYARGSAVGWLALCVLLFSLSAFGFVLRLRERSLADEIADAEDKLLKRVLRRVAKTLPETVSAVVSPLVPEQVAAALVPFTDGEALRRAVQREVAEQIAGAQVQRTLRTFVGDALVKAAQSER